MSKKLVKKFLNPSGPIEYVGMPKNEWDWMTYMYMVDPNNPQYKLFLQYAKDKYGRQGDIRLPEVVVEAKRPEKTLKENTKETILEMEETVKNLPTETKVDLALTGAGFIPGLDTVADVFDLGRSLYNGNYNNAAWSLAGLALPVSGQTLKKTLKWIDNFKNRKLRMTHVTTMSDIQKSIAKGDKPLITPSFSIYKDNGHNLFMYNKENLPVVFIGNRDILDDSNYILLKGDLGVPMLDNMFDFTLSNSDISKLYVDIFGSEIRDRGYRFNDTRKNLNYVNYNEGKYLGELPYSRFSYVIGPDTKEFKEIFKDLPYITYSTDWLEFDKNNLRLHLLRLIEDTYSKNKEIRLKQGGRLIPKHSKGSPVNNNPLPKHPINTNPIPKKKDKKKLFEIDLRTVGHIPPLYLTFPKGAGNGLYMIKRNE